jgi:hypothetical protein
VTGRLLVPQPTTNLRLQLGCQISPFCQTHEQHHPGVAPLPLSHGHRLQDLIELFHDAVDLGGADANARSIESGVGPAENHHAAAGCPHGVVAVGPDPGEPLEVGLAVPVVTVLAPEGDRHRRERHRAHEFPLLIRTERIALVVEDRHGHAESRPLDLARIDRFGGVAANETAAQVSAARNRSQMNIGFDAVVDEGKALGRQR